MKVILARKAGFCMGVARAVKMVEDALSAGKRVCMLGALVHNPQMITVLCEKGARVIEDISEVVPGETVVLRAHGTEKALESELRERGIPVIDTTCPWVKKTYGIVEKAGDAAVVLLGEPGHPEVRAIADRCSGKCIVVKDGNAFEKLCRTDESSVQKNYILASQSTSKLEEWQKCIEITKKLWTPRAIFGTMCNATRLRQNEAEALSKSCGMTVVVGGRGSSNTKALYDICARNGPAVMIETAKELTPELFVGQETVGITAGASTPAFIIKEVQEAMSDIANVRDEMSFEEMLEQSFKTIYSREKVIGVVTSVSQNELAVDIGTKHAGYVPFYEYTDDPNARLEELVKVGDQLELLVLRVNDVEGTAMLSKKRLDAIAGFEKIMDAEKSGEILEGTVVDVVKGGVIAVSNGVRVFIPASQATVSRGQPLEPLLKTKVQFKILETNDKRRRAVGSIRAVVKEQRKVLEEQFWNEVGVGKTYQGTVKSLTSYGVFVDLGGVDGMVHISELSWSRIKNPSEVVSVGDPLEVMVKDVDRENKKVSLGYKKNEENPWELLQKQYAAGDVAKVKIVSMTPYGAFAQVIPGVDGLIHISQISNERIGKPADVLAIGQEVDAKITDIDLEKKRVSLSIRAVLAEIEKTEDEEEPPIQMEFGPPTQHEGQPDGESTPQEVELPPETEAAVVEVTEEAADTAEQE